MTAKGTLLGIDLGSISLKVVLLDHEGNVLFSRWTRVAGAPFEKLSQVFCELHSKFPKQTISSIGITGSGRQLLAPAVHAASINEISAHAAAAGALHPEIKTIIEIGGQDSKLVVLGDDRGVCDFRMNELCAAGTGAFLDQQAARLGLTIEEFANLALEAKESVPIAGRCAVFAKTDMTHHQQEGRPLADIAAGLNDALARSYLAGLVRGRMLPKPIAFQGGVASNRGLGNSFRKILDMKGDELVVPSEHRVMGAIGAALLGQDRCKNRIELGRLIEDFDEYRSTHEGISMNSVRTHEELTPCASPPLKPEWQRLDLDGTYIGIDVGSVSVKVACIDSNGVRYSDYRFSDGRPIDVLREMIARMRCSSPEASFLGAGVTGSGRHFIGKLIDADVIVNEITSQALAANALHQGVDTIIEIGGQDSKFIRLDDGKTNHFAMNRVCAAGTGAFLQEQAKRLDIDLAGEFSKRAFMSKKPCDLGARCTVFMESDLVSHQQMGFDKDDLIAGLSLSVITNYLEKVVAGHPIGEKVLFLGGVSENAAVVAACRARLGKEVSTSEVGKLTGAIGAAFAAFRARREGVFATSSFKLNDDTLNTETFRCTDCPNSCLITRLVASPDHTFGGRCGKWDDDKREARPAGKSLIWKRKELLEKPCADDLARRTTRDARRKIGVPRALLAFDMLPLWRTFFESMGFDVMVSPETCEGILNEGRTRLVVENCLPVKSLCAHIVWLDSHGECDFIFVPSYVITGNDAHGRDTAHCPYIQSAAQFARPVSKTPILNPVINWRFHPSDEEKAMMAIAQELGVSNGEAKSAWRRAKDAQGKFKDNLRAIGDSVLDELANGRLARAFVVLGKDYNVNDPRLNSNAVKLLEDMNETVITQDMLTCDGGCYSKTYSAMYWSHGKEMLAAAEIAAKTKGLYPILITSFGCGPDSFTIPLVRDIMGDKPLLQLEVDEHASSVGMETRMEAFLDSLPAAQTSRSTEPRRPFRASNGIKRVYLPNFSDHGLAFAAAFKSLGLTPILTDLPDDDSASLGAEHSCSGECHPYVLMLGDYLKVAKRDDDFTDACYFMPQSAACRVGLFGLQMRLAAEKSNASLPVFTCVEDIAPSVKMAGSRVYLKAISAYWEMMRGMDLFMQKYLETRAFERKAGTANRARQEGLGEIRKGIMDDSPLEGLKRAVGMLDQVPRDVSKRPVRIGITGDYYTRVCDYANNEMFRDIERMGGMIYLPPTMTEFIKYGACERLTQAINHRDPSKMVAAMAMRAFVSRREKRVKEIFGDSLEYDVPLDYHESMKRIEPYMDSKLPAGLTGSVAAIIEQIRAGADGILSLITFHCTYGLVISSVLKSIDDDYPDIPKLTLIFEGLKPTHNRLRLEAFMEQVHVASRRRRRTR